MADPQTSATQVLGSIPFGYLIGAPLRAAVEAQAAAAESSVTFIRNVTGITLDDKNQPKVPDHIPTVAFKYKATDGTDLQLEVPILTIVPIPFVRIDDLTIDFKASISAATETSESKAESTAGSLSISASARYLFFKASLNGSISSKKDSTSTASSRYSVEYTVDVHVHAVQDDMPKGMATVLAILNEGISARAAGKEKPAGK